MKAIDNYLQKRRFVIAGRWIPFNSKLLDIGCNQGEFFLFLKEKRISGFGIDPEADIPDSSLPENVKIIRSPFPCAKLQGERFDVITALAIFEHIETGKMTGFLQACLDSLDPGGRIILTIPSPLVDYLLAVLKFTGLIDGMHTDQHHGFKIGQTIPAFTNAGFRLVLHKKFQLGLNNLFIFEK